MRPAHSRKALRGRQALGLGGAMRPQSDMRRLLERAQDAFRVAWTWASIGREARKNAARFKDVHTFCLFVGYPRSGHSIIGALLDAHPNAVMAHELGALKYFYVGFDRVRLYHLITMDARRRSHRHGRSPYFEYCVPGQWQGRFERIQVIGDKHGEGASWRLRANPWLLERVRKTVAVRLRIIHVTRNPFDNISTMAIRKAGGAEADPSSQISKYFTLCESVSNIRRLLEDEELIEFRHEEFVDDPRSTLLDLCQAVGLEADGEYLDACSGIVYKAPHRSRERVSWRPEARKEVERRMSEFPFLEGYRFDR